MTNVGMNVRATNLSDTPITLARRVANVLNTATTYSEQNANRTRAAVSSTQLPYVPVAPNATLPPEQYRFIPGSTPTFVNGTVIGGTRFKDATINTTGYYYIEDGEVEPGPNEIQTLFLACFATLIPLVIILATGFTIRVLWKRYKTRRQCIEYDGVVHRDNSVESYERPLHSQLLNGDKLTGAQMSAEEGKDGDVLNGIRTTTMTRTISAANTNRKPATANGSIITMTLKNNHLIVETEERNDIEQNRRETTMKYSPSARADVFVVEMSQGGTHSSTTPVSQVTASTPYDSHMDVESMVQAGTCCRRELPTQAQTGLSQSNQSLSSSSYAYSSDLHDYDGGGRGYATYSGCSQPGPQIGTTSVRTESCCKPRITSAIYKHRDSFDDLIADGDGDGDEVDDDQREQMRLGNEINGN